MQIIGKHFDESTVLAIAYAYEQLTHWRKRKPNL
jgi:Asp-tRNA(Asn)/Glu-tRNA(Gln) amidotransferase A subunit family amidase